MTTTAAQRRSRGERFIAGATVREIADADGVSAEAVRTTLKGLIYRAGHEATPQTELPSGLMWRSRGSIALRRVTRAFPWREWYVTGTVAGYVTPAAVKWALKVFDEHATAEAPICECCGRPM